ncbi:MAG: phosphoglucosamine mutase [Bacteroidetes bacterium]|nr:phosphoglucosamine mutase [Bacteroidota bacterium]
MSRLIRSISGIRGIVGETLLPETVVTYVSAFAQWCGGGPIVLGSDGRPHGQVLTDLARAVLQFSGVDVIDCGVVPTPTVQLVTEHSEALGGIAITASHNPAQWNGLKFLNSTGVFLDAEENAALFALADAGARHTAAWNGLGTLHPRTDVLDEHIDRVLTSVPIDLDAIRARRFRVAVDAVNASGSFIVPRLLERLGCEVLRVACDGSGVFPHTPEPLPENLVSLGDAVRSLGADLGIAVDPDADRLVLFTEEGKPFGEEYSITTAVDAVLRMLAPRSGLAVAVNLSTTRAVDDVAARYGATVLRSPVGEINVVKIMKQYDAVIGGEGSGGIIMPAVHAGRDSLVGIALVLHALAASGGSASAYRAALPQYEIRKFKYSTDGLDTAAVLERAAATFSAERIDTRDGVRIDFDAGWVHLRASNTEPIMRVIAEAADGTEAVALAATVADVAFAGDARPL